LVHDCDANVKRTKNLSSDIHHFSENPKCYFGNPNAMLFHPKPPNTHKKSHSRRNGFPKLLRMLIVR
jgi:hypothetical protein